MENEQNTSNGFTTDEWRRKVLTACCNEKGTSFDIVDALSTTFVCCKTLP